MVDDIAARSYHQRSHVQTLGGIAGRTCVSLPRRTTSARRTCFGYPANKVPLYLRHGIWYRLTAGRLQGVCCRWTTSAGSCTGSHSQGLPRALQGLAVEAGRYGMPGAQLGVQRPGVEGRLAAAVPREGCASHVGRQRLGAVIQHHQHLLPAHGFHG